MIHKCSLNPERKDEIKYSIIKTGINYDLNIYFKGLWKRIRDHNMSTLYFGKLVSLMLLHLKTSTLPLPTLPCITTNTSLLSSLENLVNFGLACIIWHYAGWNGSHNWNVPLHTENQQVKGCNCVFSLAILVFCAIGGILLGLVLGWAEIFNLHFNLKPWVIQSIYNRKVDLWPPWPL